VELFKNVGIACQTNIFISIYIRIVGKIITDTKFPKVNTSEINSLVAVINNFDKLQVVIIET